MTIFSTNNVSKTYANHKALDKVSINVEKGSVFGLLGPNGAGKTTLIRIINQITAPDEGEIYFMGEKLRSEHVHKIGYLPEERGLYKKMKVGEQAIYLAELKGIKKAEAKKRLEYWFNKFDIYSWWNRKVEELSKGMQQKVQFITTILHEPDLLIFDEPFSGFDPINANLLKEEILKLKNKGATIIFSTHNMESVEAICDSIALINKSKKILDGRVDEIKQRFKKNEFEIILSKENDISDFIFDGVELINKNTDLNFQVSTLKIKKGINADLLSKILQKTDIISYKEILPTMNEIFIDTVSNE
ncbi:Vitamin B12 import ATP-binding protein BtuD [bioreactor metagenome]|jgi:ABC-2 type transport system ATP-binding protein|uniref:Vitamin B12 import ATP-binding protein BtuD n=1 Tax=bioreactor metagenome TaxID=1076179 RepID=A0A644UF35_9ZZZZ|nr:ABC transporter ATP-binding protein [Bacteroidales bacterium]MDY4789144.1 ABC transporter ATP-binding protein [Bacteroidales bacterium]MEA4968729.1 ABC transporter ATP-binding protein [Bacteroidaceae bacterium]MEA5099894.1 ABC transporter ATP-binding protein [Bacteroidales bacterium]NCC17648.1 ATP-binding cassette domain-containing protein [Bacteroidia bacterium]